MSSRRNGSAGVAIVELVAYLPWWVGVFMAAGSYWGLHWYATRSLPTRWGFAETSQMVTEAMMRGLAIGAQYLLPILFLIAAVTSILRRRKRRQLLAGVSAAPDALNAMSWREFEMLVGEAFWVLHQARSRVRTGPERDPYRWPAASHHDPAGVPESLAGEGFSRPERSGRFSSVPHMQQADGDAYRPPRAQDRPAILGMHRVPNLHGHARHRLIAHARRRAGISL